VAHRDLIYNVSITQLSTSNRYSQCYLYQKIHLFLPISIFPNHLRGQPIQEDELLRVICRIIWPIEIEESPSIGIQVVYEMDYIVSQFLTDEKGVQEVGCVKLFFECKSKLVSM